MKKLKFPPVLAVLAVGLSLLFLTTQPTLAAKKTVTFGATGTSFPTAYKNDGKLVGFDVEVANTIAKRLGYKAKWVTADFDGLFGSIDNKKIDTIPNDVAVTPERKETYLFSNPYNYEPTAVAVGKDSKFKTIKDLEGHKVAGGLASNNTKALKKYDSKINVVTFETRDQTFQALTSGHVDGVVNTRPILKALIREKNLPWKVVSGTVTNTKIAFPFKNDARGKKLQKQFNHEIKQLYKDGTLAKLANKYFGYDTTKS